MNEQLITPQTNLISSTQEEAVTNVRSAPVFGVEPSIFKQNREALLPEVQKMSLSPTATPVVARNIATSEEHAAAIAPDSEKLSWVERQWGNIGNAVSSKIGDERRLVDLNWKKLRSGGAGADEFTELDDMDLQSLRESARENFGKKDYGVTGTWESLPADVIAQGVDMVALAGRNAKTILGLTAAGTAAGAGVGAAAGSLFFGVGAVPGAVSGAAATVVPALAGAYVVGAGIDAYQTTAASTYGELDTAIDETTGKPLAIDPRNKEYISHGVGLVSGALSIVTDKLQLKSVPFLKKLLAPSSVKDLVLNPANLALKQTLIGIGKSISINATEESLQEAVQIIGEEVGNTYQNGEVAFTNGLMRASEKIAKNQDGARDRVGRAGLVGGVTGGTLAAGGSVAYKGLERVSRRLNEPGKISVPTSDIVGDGKAPPAQAVDVLQLQDVIDASKLVTDEAKLKKLSPEMISDMRKQITNEAGVAKVFLNKEDLSTNDPIKAEKIRNAIDESGTAAAAINAPIKMETHKFLDLVDQYPDLSEHVRLNPEGPSPNSARAYLENVQKAEVGRAKIKRQLDIGEKSPDERAYAATLAPDMDDRSIQSALGTKEVADAYLARLDVMDMEAEGGVGQLSVEEITLRKETNAKLREKVTALKETLPDDTTAQQTLKAALELPQPSNDVFSESDYLNQPTFTQAIEGVLSDKEVETINKAQREVKQKVVDNINEAAKYEMNKVIDVVEAQSVEIQYDIETERIANDPNIAIADQFQANNTQPTHQKKGYSAFAIDPRSMPDEMRAKFAKDPQLKKHKVFVKGGIDLDTAADLLGFTNGERMLEILQRTPRRKDAINGAVEMKKAALRAEAEASVDLDKTSLSAAYHANTSNHIQEMKALVSEKWSAAKKGIKRIALPLPKIEDLTRQAKNAVAQSKVGDLNANQFKVGERKSQRIAVESVLKNDLEKAFVNKQAAALNSELANQTHIAIGKVNRVVKLVKRMESADVRQQLKDAGPLYQKAVDELLSHYNMRKESATKLEERSDYQSWVKKQVEAGNGNFEIPDRLSDPRASLSDMTVEEVQVVGDRLKAILKQAQMKNRLWEEFGDPAKDKQTLANLVTKLHDQATTHIDYDLERTEVKQGDISEIDKAVRGLRNLRSMVANAEFILLNIDQNKVGGLASEAILAPLKGVGKYSGQGESGKGADMAALGKHFDKIIETIGKNDWDKMQNTRVDVPEFAGNTKLYKGKLTKGNLFMMLLNGGNAGNMQRMADNFGTDMETIRTVLDREMDGKYAVAAQQVMDTYASYFDRVRKLHEEMTGITPEFVEAVPFTHKGKVYPGGYYPLNYAQDLSPDKIRRSTQDVLDSVTGEKEFSLKDHFYTDDMTKHGHTETRVGSDQQVDLSMETIGVGLERVLHDLNFRKPIANALKILTDKTVATDFTAVVGIDNYRVLVNTVVGAAGSLQAENTAMYNGTLGNPIVARVRSGLSVGVLAFNAGSILIQPLSLSFAVKKMGLTGPKHMLAVVGAVLKDVRNYGEFQRFAGEITSSIRDNIEGINETQRDIISEKTPPKNANKITAWAEHWRSKMSDVAFKALGMPDQFMKVLVSLSAYRQFMEGDAPGYSSADIAKMTNAERDSQAKVYASAVTRQTLTAGSKIDRSQIQNDYKNLAMFFNDSRNIINNTIQSAREVTQSSRRGDYGKASLEAASMIAILAAAKLYEDTIRGNPTPLSGGKDEEEPVDWASYILGAPIKIGLQSIPVVRDANYLASMAIKTDRDQTGAGLYSKVITDVALSAKIAYDYMDYIQGDKELRGKDIKAIGMVASYATGGLPVIGAYKFVTGLQDLEENSADYKRSLSEMFNFRLESFKKSQEDADPEDKISADEMAALDAIAEQIPSPRPVENQSEEEVTLDN